MPVVKDPTRSMTSYKTHCEKNAKKMDDFLTENPELGPEHLQVLKKLNADLEKQFERMETSWFSMLGDIEDVPAHTALEKMFNDVDDHVTKTLRVSQKAILEPLRDTSESMICSRSSMVHQSGAQRCRLYQNRTEKCALLWTWYT